jgi:hypothetical protein
MSIEQIFGNRLVAFQYAFQGRTVRLLGDAEPPVGAHLVTPWRGFAHHGVYLGGGRVIHYNARVYRLRRRPVEETDMSGFAEGRPVFLVDHADAVYATDEVLRRARSRLGEDRSASRSRARWIFRNARASGGSRSCSGLSSRSCGAAGSWGWRGSSTAERRVAIACARPRETGTVPVS